MSDVKAGNSTTGASPTKLTREDKIRKSTSPLQHEKDAKRTKKNDE